MGGWAGAKCRALRAEGAASCALTHGSSCGLPGASDSLSATARLTTRKRSRRRRCAPVSGVVEASQASRHERQDQRQLRQSLRCAQRQHLLAQLRLFFVRHAAAERGAPARETVSSGGSVKTKHGHLRVPAVPPRTPLPVHGVLERQRRQQAHAGRQGGARSHNLLRTTARLSARDLANRRQRAARTVSARQKPG